MSHEPDIRLGGLSLWTMGREFPDSNDYWDGNWLNVRARVEAPGAWVEVSGPWLRNDELTAFVEDLAAVHRDLSGTAELRCIEPALRVKVTCDALGHVGISVEVTPDHLSQSHRFEFGSDQTYLPDVVRRCRSVLARFPVKGKR